MHDELERILGRYTRARTTPEKFGTSHELWRTFEAARTSLSESPPVQRLRLRRAIEVRWGAGQGNWAKVPWIALLGGNVSMQRGVYVVYLFRQDMSGVYLTLNQGVTEPTRRLGSRLGRDEVRQTAVAIRQHCTGLAEAGFSLEDDIELRADPGLGANYESSTIAHKLYQAGTVPDDSVLFDDLEAVLGAYDEYLESPQKYLNPQQIAVNDRHNPPSNEDSPSDAPTVDGVAKSFHEQATSEEVGLRMSQNTALRFVTSLMSKRFAERATEFSQQYPHANFARSTEEILEDNTVHLIVSAVDPEQRAGLGVDAMRHGKDYLCAKPAFTTLEQLDQVKQVQAQTQRIYTIYFGERLGNKATLKAGDLVYSGAIGRVIQTVGFGPHRLGQRPRPEWTYHREQHGGILNDLASHQIDQFLFFTGSKHVQIVAAHVGNFNHPQYPAMDDFGDLTLRSDHATGYCRVDWLTPDGLGTWGDVRLFILGTEGTIEIRKNCDLGRSDNPNHLFLVDQDKTHVIDCSNTDISFATKLIDDILNRSETMMTQAHCFLTSELALMAEAQAHRISAPRSFEQGG